jgi:predicted XRE-type DNA-binding protein
VPGFVVREASPPGEEWRGRGVPPKTEQLLAQIKAWSVSNDVKQVELAKMLGVQRSAVTDWYKRRKTPTGEQVLTMLELLKTKPQPKRKVSPKSQLKARDGT